ncbi:MAG: chorismate synthase [Candidatus Bathyarchaeota archaeon]|nr:chorismate synthase [Candidatus Bathyarchaeota archaeon]
MGSNSIGKEFVVTSFGESHGKCVGVVIEGCPAGLPLSKQDIQKELAKRIPPNPSITSGRREEDVVEILSGVFDGFTTGAPICSLVWNKDAISSAYDSIRDKPRPGHADYPARIKYGGFNDYRGGGRFSGRTTLALVIAGAISRKLLDLFDVRVTAYTAAIGDIALEEKPVLRNIESDVYKSSVRCPDLECSKAMENAIIEARKEGDSIGGIVECVAQNIPVGLGEPVFSSLDADFAKLLLSIPAVKGVEFGAGFTAARLKGSQNNDPFVIRQGRIATLTNNAGGILGGLSSGMPILVRIAIKPTPSISKEQTTVDLLKKAETSIRLTGRHDPCIVPKAVPVVESALSIIISDHMLRAGFIPKVLKERC